MVLFGYTILYVSDVNKAISFYEKSFGFSRKFITPENDYAELATGQTILSFASKELANSNLKNGFRESRLEEKPFGIELGFVTENVNEILNRIQENGGSILEAAKKKPWGQIVAYIRDIDGFLIEICSPPPLPHPIP